MPGKFKDIPLNLEILAEECAEVIKEMSNVIQIKSKIIRFGLEDRHPDGGPDGPTNRERLEVEIGHVLAMVRILIANGVLTTRGLLDAKEKKFLSLEGWYQPFQRNQQ